MNAPDRLPRRIGRASGSDIPVIISVRNRASSADALYAADPPSAASLAGASAPVLSLSSAMRPDAFPRALQPVSSPVMGAGRIAEGRAAA